mmetsp:Transcript_11779/g.21019  ORF Transcript_11779/g.21019 Transcript_11779/m.21019 type:complete len:620 (-) Transcript_11779:115-1974(-)
MGVPAFYRWLSEKYPKITVDMLEERPKVVAGTAIPTDLTGSNPNGIEYDNLYIDMNGIIHPCSHPEDAPPPETEEQMYLNVTKYVDRLVAAVRPRRLLFLAIDGTAPRAKMNQQRARRFKSAQEARERAETMKEVRAELEAMGHALPPEKAGEWDSNVITPGTPFMAKLSRFLRFYIRDRMNKSKYWQGIKVIFSDAQEPGEGEHKIMAFVRRQRCQPGYDANQHHILHGLDADLIMLGLATHEARFTILREEVTFGRRNEEMRKVARAAAEEAAALTTGREVSGAWPGAPEDAWLTQKPLQRLELWTLREYLRAEFQCLESALPFEYDFERVVDDFVFMCMFVGNDFLPNVPHLDIADGALNTMISIYREMLPELGGYLTDKAAIHRGRFELLMAELARREPLYFMQRGREEQDAGFANPSDPLAYRDYYYKVKLGFAEDDEAARRQLVACYLEGLYWVLQYYHEGCSSWSWFYPNHYAPLASDLRNLQELEIQYPEGRPFSQYMQLLTVLPKESSNFLPPAYAELMTPEPTNPLQEFFPADFESDPNGKRNSWEAVVLIPFIDYDKMVENLSYIDHKNTLTEAERKRNILGREFEFLPPVLSSGSKKKKASLDAKND